MESGAERGMLPSLPPLHLLDDVKHGWANQRIAGVHDGATEEVLIGERVSLALLWPHFVDRAFVVLAQEWTGHRPGSMPFVSRLQVGGNELFSVHSLVFGNPGDVLVAEHGPQRAAAVRAHFVQSTMLNASWCSFRAIRFTFLSDVQLCFRLRRKL